MSAHDKDASQREWWLNCKDDPTTMMLVLPSEVSRRKLGLFTVACCRKVWHLTGGTFAGHTLRNLEHAVEGVGSWLFPLLNSLGALPARPNLSPRQRAVTAVWHACQMARTEAFLVTHNVIRAAEEAQDALAAEAEAMALAEGVLLSVASARYCKAWQGERERQVRLFRDILGNPFASRHLDPCWLAQHGGRVQSIARVIYEEGRFSDMPILADALEEAGCENAAILSHCREPGEHVRGCWVIDLLLGKA
jgi:hypothetical protein